MNGGIKSYCRPATCFSELVALSFGYKLYNSVAIQKLDSSGLLNIKNGADFIY